jgi:hypothetical protein
VIPGFEGEIESEDVAAIKANEVSADGQTNVWRGMVTGAQRRCPCPCPSHCRHSNPYPNPNPNLTSILNVTLSHQTTLTKCTGGLPSDDQGLCWGGWQGHARGLQ